MRGHKKSFCQGRVWCRRSPASAEDAAAHRHRRARHPAAASVGAPARLHPGELAGALGVHPSSVYRWCAKGLLRADASAGFTLIKLDEAIRFSREGPRRT